MLHANRERALRGCVRLANPGRLRNNVARFRGNDTPSFMDKLDSRSLELLQGNGELSAAEIADRIGLSKAPCWRRIQKLQAEGIIRGTVALLDARAMNVGTTVFVR